MRKVKKIASLFLALVMTFAMTTTVFADGADGTITVTNPAKGETYTVYKVFDLSYQNVTQEGETETLAAYTYTKQGENDSLYKALSGSDSPFTLTLTSVGNVYNVALKQDKSEADIVQFLAVLVKNQTLTTSIESKEAGEQDTSIQFTNLDYGYYYVASTLGAVVSLTSTTKDAEIVDKNVMTFDKTDDQESVEIGDIVNYEIKAKVPDYTSFETYIYQITDTMSEGLTFQKDVSVMVGDTAISLSDGTNSADSAHKVTYNDKGFTLELDVKQFAVGADITVTYSAKVNEDAVSVISKNKAVLKYSNDPTDATSTKEITDEETVYSAKIVIDKYEKDKDTKKLSGAKFVLYRYASASVTDGATTYSFKDQNGNAYTDESTEEGLVKVYYHATETTAGTGNETSVTDVGWVETQDEATEVTTDQNGAANFPGLEDGVYYLQETEAPAGYNILTDAVKVTINGANATVNDTSSLTGTKGVENSTGSFLPSTGGMGTTIFYIVGAILVIVAAVLLIVRRRMNSEK